MGADLHVRLCNRDKDADNYEEIALYRISKNGKYSRAMIGEDRNYQLFALLAGVRGCEDEMPVGTHGIFPEAPETILNYFDPEQDGDWLHSHKWFRWNEIMLATKQYGKIKDYLGKKYNPVKRWLKELQVILDANLVWNTDEVIIQIAFDN